MFKTVVFPCASASLPPRQSAAGEAELCLLHPQLTLREAWTDMLRHQSLPLHFQVLISHASMRRKLEGQSCFGVGEVPGGHAADSPGVLTVLLAGLKGF